MAKPPTMIHLNAQERATLRRWIRDASVHQKMAERARIILMASEGRGTQEIAEELRTRPARISKWRTRFAAHGLAGLWDRLKAPAPRRYGAAAEKRILELIKQRPAPGRSTWTGELISETLGDVSPDQVWRVLRNRGIALVHRRGQRLSIEREFGPRLVAITGLFLASSVSALAIAAWSDGLGPRTSGIIRVPNPRLSTSFAGGPADAPASGLAEALATAAELARGGEYLGRGRREIADFVEDAAAACGPGGALHVLVSSSNELPRLVPNAIWYPAATFEDWLREAGHWLSVFEQPGSGSADRTLHAIELFVSASMRHRASPFEWCINDLRARQKA